MNGVMILIGGLLLLAAIKLVMDRDWVGLLLFAVAIVLMFGTGHHNK